VKAIVDQIVIVRTGMMSKKSSKSKDALIPAGDYDGLLGEVVSLLEAARHTSARAVNAVMTATYWEIGRRIVEVEQEGSAQAEYGEELVKRLAADLTKQFGRGFSWRNVYQMRAFHLAYPEILQTASAKLVKNQTNVNLQTLSANSQQPRSAIAVIERLVGRFPLPWSHYTKLLAVKDENGRQFYEQEALRSGWTVRQLDRQISSQFYERTLLSKNKSAMLRKGAEPQPEDLIRPEDEIKDPFVLEFLNLKDEYSEHDLEEALIHRLEDFLLELGGDFAFIGRQKRLRIGDEWYRIDLLFFHRKLKCLVVIDLKIGKFTHADAGQMHLYLNYAREHWTHEGENPPVGLILCAQKDEAVAHYSLEGLPNKVMTSEYRLALPEEKLLEEQLERTQRALEVRDVKDTKQQLKRKPSKSVRKQAKKKS
jgi:predicted nuclease of restriction endonuclease-like (RecB) superfamily